MQVRLMVVDDDEKFRTALKASLELDRRLSVVAEAADGIEALTLAATLRPNVVFMDYDMPGLNGVEATTRLREATPESRVILLTGNDDEEVMAAAYAAGACRCVRKRDLVAVAGLALAVGLC